MAEIEGSGTETPQTLKPNLDTPSLVDDVGVENLSPKEYTRAQEDLYYGHLAEQNRQGRVLRLNKTSGRVEELTGGGVSTGNEFLDKERGVGGAEKWSAATDAARLGQQYYESWKDAERQLEWDKEDAKEAKAAAGGSGSGRAGVVRTYLDVEMDKTDEITRQYEDFQDRASLLYDLMADEQAYGMRADDQNIQNMKAQQDLGMAINPGGFYTKPLMSDALSGILSPSLPEYVRPDYRLNGAVGLPGPQGFDDSQYDEYGMPMFAHGTDPNAPLIPWPWRKE
jgi:hypothetical protein